MPIFNSIKITKKHKPIKIMIKDPIHDKYIKYECSIDKNILKKFLKSKI